MLRKVIKSKLGLILAFIFAISMFFWRQSSSISNFFNSDNVITKVGNTSISTSKFIRTVQMNIQQFNDILEKNISGEEVRNFQIHQLALGALINDAIYENEFDKLNFILDDTVIAKKTKEIIPQLYNENNELDENYLQRFQSEQRLKVEDIVQIVHFETRKKLFNEVLLDIKYPSVYSRNIEIYNQHQREIEYFNFPINKIDISTELKEIENLKNNNLSFFYEKNITNYLSDEKRNLKYIEINKENYIENFIPGESEVIEYYNNNKDLFLENEKRSFLQFNFRTLNEAEEVKNELLNTNTYEEVKTYASKNNIKYNIFDNLYKNEILDEIAESLFEIQINEKSPIIKSPIAFHIVVLKNIEPKKQLSFEEVKNDIKEDISNIDTTNYLIDLENNIAQDILDGIYLNNLASKYNIKLLSINNLTKLLNNYEELDKALFESIKDRAFSSNLNFTNDIVKLNQDRFYVFEVSKIEESEPLDLKDIKEKVLKDWKKKTNKLKKLIFF